METLKPKKVEEIRKPAKIDIEGLKKAIEGNMDRYQRIRDGVIAVFKLNDLAPIEIYEVANLLDFIAMKEYQIVLIDFMNKEVGDGKDYSKYVSFKLYEKAFEGADEYKKAAWKKVVEIFEMEKVKVIELSRIAAELRTSAMEAFIQALDVYIQQKKGEE